MTTFKIDKLPVWCAELNGESPLPPLADIQMPCGPREFHTEENDGLWLNFDCVETEFPYRSQDCYSRELTTFGLDCVVLENDCLRASFAINLGGKLWSLYDKEHEKELLFSNHVFKPAFLAIRNAWSSGGVEWNCGAFPGHNPHTCSPMFADILSEKESGIGCPVLRMFTYERIRRVTQQMDFYLPEKSRYLHCRMRVVNENLTRTDMYWWSNIAVPSDDCARCVVPADFAFTTETGPVSKVAIPYHNNIDISYPTQIPVSADYFFKTYENERRYTSHIGKDGYGFVETSTSRLKGRKLFVWGKGQGGEKWQEYLSGDDGHGKYQNGKYCEIQCGLADTQYECLPMPPKTAWEWIEYYGHIKADPRRIHGTWNEAQREVSDYLDNTAPLRDMEQELLDTHKMALTPATNHIHSGLGWGALENIKRKHLGQPPLSPHLDFGDIGEEQKLWENLLKYGSLRDANPTDIRIPPLSYQNDQSWIHRLEKAAKSADRHYWLTHYLLGCYYLSVCSLEDAEEALNVSCTLCQNAWNTYAIAQLYRIKGQMQQSAVTMASAAKLAPDNDALCAVTVKTLYLAKMWDALEDFSESLSDYQKNIPRVKLYRAVAAIHKHDIDTAEHLLYENGGLEIPDIQEGELTVTELWFDIQKEKARLTGEPFDSNCKPPRQFDFRMKVYD